MPEALAREIDIFETQIELRKKGKIEEKLFAETRLRRGVYGQRYDNGQRHDGEKTQTAGLPLGRHHQGPHHHVGRPGHAADQDPDGPPQRRPAGGAGRDRARSTRDGILHVTTRQDIQLHFVHIEDTPDLMRRLAAVGITTREACGNTVRNVTACPLAGVCRTEAFDVTPYAHALTYFLLGHDDTQDFGRKFKVAFSGCHEEACGLTNFHDVGLHRQDARRRRPGEARLRLLRRAAAWAAVPYAAQLIDEFLPEEELLPLTQAIARVFARLGEKANRDRARLKFLVKKLGFAEFKRLVLEERQRCGPTRAGPRSWPTCTATDEKPLRPAGPAPPGDPGRRGFDGLGARQRAATSARRATGWSSSRCRWAT